MRQAKRAVQQILASLRPSDVFNITAFGSHHRLLFIQPKPAVHHNLLVAKSFINQMEANMGGTKVGSALSATYGEIDTHKEECADILLITDGEVWEQEAIIERAKHSGHRIFSVGVGSAVSEGFIREIADATGGASELVSPREQMATHIVRHFQRIREPRVTTVQIDWGESVHYQSPEILRGVYSRDTVHVFASLEAVPIDSVVLTVSYEDGAQVEELAVLKPAEQANEFQLTLPRLAANARLVSLGVAAAQSMAVEYQLVTDQTSCVLVYERGNSDKQLYSPELRKVPQMLAAGWGGTGIIEQSNRADVTSIKHRNIHKAEMYVHEAESLDINIDYFDIGDLDSPSFLQRTQENEQESEGVNETFDEFLDSLDIDVTLDSLPFGILETLKVNGISTLRDLVVHTWEDLLAFEGLDEKDVSMLVEKLKALGLKLKLYEGFQ